METRLPSLERGVGSSVEILYCEDILIFFLRLDEINAYWDASYPRDLALKIFETSAGSIIVPGLAGQTSHLPYLFLYV